MSEPRKIGRPKSARGTPPKREFRCHDDEWEQIKSAATKAGRTVSEVIRSLALKWAKRTNAEP